MTWIKSRQCYRTCEYLNPFGVQPRYPFGFELVDSDATISKQKSEAIVNFIQERIIYQDLSEC